MNAGFQRQLLPGMVLSVDYLRNVNLHYLIGVDLNHSGDVRQFSKATATLAPPATLTRSFGVRQTSAVTSAPVVLAKVSTCWVIVLAASLAS